MLEIHWYNYTLAACVLEICITIPYFLILMRACGGDDSLAGAHGMHVSHTVHGTYETVYIIQNIDCDFNHRSYFNTVIHLLCWLATYRRGCAPRIHHER